MNHAARLIAILWVSIWIGAMAGCGTAENENISDEDFQKILDREHKAESAMKQEAPEE